MIGRVLFFVIIMMEKKMTRDAKMVISTSEATIVVCQCGNTGFNVKKQTKTAVSLSCSKCGCDTSVKGPVALANVPQNEIQAAVSESVVRPDPEYKPKKKDDAGGNVEGSEEKKYTMLRFKVGIEAKKNVIDRAMEVVRVMHCDDQKFGSQMWQGHALEYIAAEILAGCDPNALDIVDEMNAAVIAIDKEMSEAGKKKALIKRRIRDEKLRIMRTLAVQYGLIDEILNTNKKSKQKKKSDDAKCDNNDPGDSFFAEDHGLIVDDGRLSVAVKRAFLECSREYFEETRDKLPIMIDIGRLEAMKRAEKDGGFVIIIYGDSRTCSVGGKRPESVVWLGMEPSDMALEVDLIYSEVMDDILQDGEVEIIELLPENYETMDEKAQWEAPSFCTGRVVNK